MSVNKTSVLKQIESYKRFVFVPHACRYVEVSEGGWDGPQLMDLRQPAPNVPGAQKSPGVRAIKAQNIKKDSIDKAIASGKEAKYPGGAKAQANSPSDSYLGKGIYTPGASGQLIKRNPDGSIATDQKKYKDKQDDKEVTPDKTDKQINDAANSELEGKLSTKSAAQLGLEKLEGYRKASDERFKGYAQDYFDRANKSNQLAGKMNVAANSTEDPDAKASLNSTKSKAEANRDKDLEAGDEFNKPSKSVMGGAGGISDYFANRKASVVKSAQNSDTEGKDWVQKNTPEKKQGIFNPDTGAKINVQKRAKGIYNDTKDEDQ